MINIKKIPYSDVILEKDSRWTWKILAFQAGSLNIFGFLAAHHFVSHITSFASNFAIFFYKGHFFEAAVFLFIPLAFLLGSFSCAIFTEVRRKKQLSPQYTVPLFITVILLSSIYILGLIDFWSPFGRDFTDPKDLLILVITCFSMGMQNALFTTVSGGIIRTTHLTGITTDLGIELAENLFLKKRILSSRNRYRIGSIFFFFLGAIVGTYLYINLQYQGLLMNIGIGIILTSYFYHKIIRSDGFQ